MNPSINLNIYFSHSNQTAYNIHHTNHTSYIIHHNNIQHTSYMIQNDSNELFVEGWFDLRIRKKSITVSITNKLIYTYINPMLIAVNLILMLLTLSKSDIIISASCSKCTVFQQNNTVSLKILTTSTFTNGSLKIRLPLEFSLNNFTNNALVNSSSVSTVTTLTTTYQEITVYTTFNPNTNYTINILNITNPSYSTNFQISLYRSTLSFSNVAFITISPKLIACSMAGLSKVVGDLTVGTLSLQNDALTVNSIIQITSPLQTTINNTFAISSIMSNPFCVNSILGSSYNCTLSSTISSQLLTIYNISTGSNSSYNISYINNPPFNGTSISLGLSIVNQNFYTVQMCSFSVVAPTILQSSVEVIIDGWDKSVGVNSTTVNMFILTYFNPPIANTLLMIYNSHYSISPTNSAVTSTTSNNNNLTYQYLSGATITSSSLSISLEIHNPISIEPLQMQIYNLLNSSFYIEQYTLNNQDVALKYMTLPLDIALTDSRTLMPAIYSITFVISFPIKNGFVLWVQITAGRIRCQDMGLYFSTTNTAISNNNVVSCNNTNILIASNISNAILLAGTFTLNIPMANPTSIKNHTMTVNLTGPSPTYYLTSTCFSNVVLSPNNQTFVITNTNPIFYSNTSFIVVQQLTLTTDIAAELQNGRWLSLSLPVDLILPVETASNNKSKLLVVNNQDGSVLNTTYNNTSNVIRTFITGVVNITIMNVVNPLYYKGSMQWSISLTDKSYVTSSTSTAMQLPSYLPTNISVFNYTFTNTTISSKANCTLTLVPTLQYDAVTYPTVIVQFLPTTLITNCNSNHSTNYNCTIINSYSFTLVYYGVVMSVMFEVQNSPTPANNSLTVSLRSNDSSLTYEALTKTYTLQPVNLSIVANMSGQYGQLGTLSVTISNLPVSASLLSLRYSNISSYLSSAVCNHCNSTNLILSGIVEYFDSFVLNVSVVDENNIVYGTGHVVISYECSGIVGCRICKSVQSNSNSSSSLICQKCFPSIKTIYSLLYSNACLQLCPISTYSTNVTCISCPNLCYNCTSTQCLECIPQYYLYNTTCVHACPIGYINNSTHCLPQPIICPSHCVDCPKDNLCNACDTNYVLLDSLCYASCPDGYKETSKGLCTVFVPPAETSYFPFAFVITAMLLLLGLGIVKCFERRSLMMGNFIGLISIIQIASIILTLIYTVQETTDILTQALCFTLFLSKFFLNMLFLIYFLKVIAMDEHFQRWVQADDSHQTLYKVLIVLSSVFSFQIMRMIYSRLLGLRIFFGKFNSTLIFKPLNYFTFIYLITTTFSIIFLCVRNIINQNGYKTSTFYTSVETIIIQALLVISCLIDNKYGHTDQFFDYQVYKVNNQFQGSNVQPIDIQEQVENGGSMHQIYNRVEDNAVEKTQSLRVDQREHYWRRKTTINSENVIQNQADEDQVNKEGQVRGGIIANKRSNLFKTKIIKDWMQLQKTMPNKLYAIRRANQIQMNQSVSPKQKKKNYRSLKKFSSVTKIEVKLPQFPKSIPDKIKKHFHEISRADQIQLQKSVIKFNEEHLQKKELSNERQILINEPSDVMTQVDQKQLQLNEKKQKDNVLLMDENSINQENISEEINYLELLQSHNKQIESELPAQSHGTQRKFIHPNRYEDQFYEGGQKQIKIKLANLQGMEREYFEKNQKTTKKHHSKFVKTRVNRQTESVYLQRLNASTSENKRKSKSKQKRLQF